MGAPDRRASSPWTPAPRPRAGERVVLGLSGGVDSSVAALALQARGCEVLGVTTRNFCVSDARYALGDAAGSCCSEEATYRARELCDTLGIRHSVLVVEDLFADTVIEDYIREYHAGHTPSPCVRCNQQVRFPQLLAFADRMGASWVATGHYARRVERGDRCWVAEGADAGKDQAYHLSRVPAGHLARVDFPLGDWTKAEVRARAAEAGLAVAKVADSQELCFVPDGRRERILGRGAGPGEIVDTAGTVLGEHPGIHLFTVGQRRGLRLDDAPGARFVVALDAARNRVVVGQEPELLRTTVWAADATLDDPDEGAPGLVARTRSRHPGIEVASVRREGTTLRVDLVPPGDRAPAPGQALVLYRDGVVVGQGRLVESQEGTLA